jgi:hypothetical protein
LARSLDHPFSLGLALTFRAASAQALGDLDAATSTPTKRRPSPASRIPSDARWCLAVSGWAAGPAGDADQGGAWIDEAIATTRATGSDQFLSYLMASRAEAYLAAGRPSEALQAARDGIAAVARTAERFYEAELHRLRGEALLATDGDASAASLAFRKGVDVATRQGASLFALRSAVRLVRLAGGMDGTRDLLVVARGTLPRVSGLAEASVADALLATASDRVASLTPNHGETPVVQRTQDHRGQSHAFGQTGSIAPRSGCRCFWHPRD